MAQRRVSDSSSKMVPGRGRLRSDVGDGKDVGPIDEDSHWSPDLEPEGPVLKTSELFRRPSMSEGLDRNVSFRSADVLRQKDGLCTAVSEEGLHGLFYKRPNTGNEEGSGERLVNFLYAKVLTDRGSTNLLKEGDMDKLRVHQSKFVDLVFGGDGQAPVAAGTDLSGVHSKLLVESGVGREAWLSFVQLFTQSVNALQDAGEDQRAVALSAVNTTKQHFASS